MGITVITGSELLRMQIFDPLYLGCYGYENSQNFIIGAYRDRLHIIERKIFASLPVFELFPFFVTSGVCDLHLKNL